MDSNIENTLKDKNIYLYKTKIKSKTFYEPLFIKIKFLEKEFISTNPIEIKKNNFAYFIYDVSYNLKRFFDLKFLQNSFIKDFFNQKFKINNLTKIMIFKEYF